MKSIFIGGILILNFLLFCNALPANTIASVSKAGSKGQNQFDNRLAVRIIPPLIAAANLKVFLPPGLNSNFSDLAQCKVFYFVVNPF